MRLGMFTCSMMMRDLMCLLMHRVGTALEYFWICTKAYATNGYYYEWREETSAATIAKRMSGGIKSDTVNQVVKLCLRIGLFDNGLFDRESILTNK